MTSSAAQPTELRTSRLLLRPPTLDDLDAYVEMATDPEYAYFGTRIDAAPESVAAGLARIVAASWERRAEFAILLKSQVIGRVRLEFDHPNQTAELGYGVARPYWGRGIGTEAAQATIDYAFSDLSLEKIWARVDPRNVGSVRVLEKLGMLQEGLFRSHVVRRGERADRAYYGILREEWLVQRAVV